ncbi:hypothetical protein FFLO_02864 [Filobasidium floriforme]|uniref:tRNA (uracil-O(2)-)-methyltransferase n=1 Tax=Filobasidium floriforme TaxID=5210 RepID=A0A8K0NTN6_9TREE|nr:uncharacterized protein HD553DRAFT_306643 [Filobasidium floriforme]KAG7558211.1 hypothetical protein FFLO_02864 [Filobasidium floriforme]KAH8088518.1 hypothetical protein HD553DRAFT_306643 [Filobasidium floriforme]
MAAISYNLESESQHIESVSQSSQSSSIRMAPNATQGPVRPKFLPRFPALKSDLADTDEPGWISVVENDAYFSLDFFFKTLEELCLHPERNSSSILRADILYDSQAGPSTTNSAEAQSTSIDTAFQGPQNFFQCRRIRRKLLPRKPQIDKPLEQDCLFLTSEVDAAPKGLVILLPDVKEEKDVPFYHPILRKLAFEYTQLQTFGEKDDPDTVPQGTIKISALPFPNSAPLPINKVQEAMQSDVKPEEDVNRILPQRTVRTCLHLLETLHKHGWGQQRGYEKRVVHDVLVVRENFQDLYLVLKERHKHLDSRKNKEGFNKIMDTKRHVWKDVAIACFLMLLWKDMYPPIKQESGLEDVPSRRPWDLWGRPAGGFLDLGCGNGLLVHILISEGYKGKGIELRERRTWPGYPAETREALVEQGIDPPRWFPNTLEEWQTGSWEGKEDCPIEEGMFLIGNHADEMTPWLPLLSLIPKTPAPHLSLPCCLHTLNGLFTYNTFVPPQTHEHMPSGDFEEGLEKGDSRYKAYLKWLGWAGLNCGWLWEKEPLRVPSTKSWGIIARKRWTGGAAEDDACREYVLSLVDHVRHGDGFTVREKEGNVDGH